MLLRFRAALVGGREVEPPPPHARERITPVRKRDDPNRHGNIVRDGSRLGVHALPSSPRPWELTLLLADREPEKYERAAVRWHRRFAQEVPHVELRESLAVIALLAAIPANRLAAAALAELLSRRRSCERIAEALVRWSRKK